MEKGKENEQNREDMRGGEEKDRRRREEEKKKRRRERKKGRGGGVKRGEDLGVEWRTGEERGGVKGEGAGA